MISTSPIAHSNVQTQAPGEGSGHQTGQGVATSIMAGDDENSTTVAPHQVQILPRLSDRVSRVLLLIMLGILGLTVHTHPGIPDQQLPLESFASINISMYSLPVISPARHDDITEGRPTSWATEVRKNSSCMEPARVLLSSAHGKYPDTETVDTMPVMEVEAGPAMDKLIEFLAIMMLAISGIALGMTIGMVACWAWNSEYLRSYLRALFTRSQHSNNPVPAPTVSTHEDDDESDDDDTVLVVVDEGSTWLVSQVSIPAEQEQGQVASQAQQ